MRTPKHVYNRIPMPARPGTCRLQVQNLSITLEGESILQDISFQLNCREIVALIGPNGAGKSSLFRSILGQMPYDGTIQFHLAGGYPAHPKIGYVPQSPSFDRGYPISVLDFFAAAISRWPVFLPVPAHLRERVEGRPVLLATHDRAAIDALGWPVLELRFAEYNALSALSSNCSKFGLQLYFIGTTPILTVTTPLLTAECEIFKFRTA